MLKGWLALDANKKEDEFWALTPRQYMLHMTAARERLEREDENRIELAWHTAHLTRVETLRPLKSYLKKREKPHKVPAEQVLDRLRGMAANLPKKTWKEWLQ